MPLLKHLSVYNENINRGACFFLSWGFAYSKKHEKKVNFLQKGIVCLQQFEYKPVFYLLG
jgi:hypothetical protein